MEESEPLSIYLELKQGQIADLEVVARAAIALAEALKEASFYIDPTLELRIELASGTESSLILNSRLRALKAKATDKKTLRGLALGAGGLVCGALFTDGYNELKAELGLQPQRSITDQDAQAIAEQLQKAAKNEPIKSHIQQFYRELDRDKAIDGVGITRIPNSRPSVVIPRSEFKVRSGVDEVVETSQQTRERTTEETLILVSPVLLQSDRKWKFRSGTGEFGASIDDEAFLADVLSGRRTVPMVSGLQIDVQMRTIEEKSEEGLWKPIDRHILRVIDMRTPTVQQSLNFGNAERDGNVNQ